MPIDSKFYKQKKSRSFYYAIAFLVFVVLVTVWLYAYNMMILGQVKDLDDSIARLDTSIEKLNQDENIQVYSLYAWNKNTFDALAAQSQIPKFVKSVKKALAKNGLDLWGFSYSDGTVSVKITSESDSRSKGYEKIVKFLKTYREDEESIFDLESITRVAGQDKIAFDAKFVVKK